MAETLREGSRGEEVRRLQQNLNGAIGQRYGMLSLDGIFGHDTEVAVEHFQTDFKLSAVDGIVGQETRNALATRVLTIEGSMTRNNTPQPVVPVVPTLPTTRQTTPPTPAPPAANNPPSAPSSPFLIQLQPAFGLTPPPFASRSVGPPPPPGTPAPSPGTLVAGQLAVGFVYRTASEGPHWEFGGAFQPSFNSRNQPTDPRYTLQLQGSVAYADPLAFGRFHTSIFAQVVLLQNLDPVSVVGGLQLGGQVSLDIIADKWSLFAQGVVAGQWTLYDSGGPAGALQFGPQFTLGTTIQWGL